ncbi:DUF3141 domain-containing protein [Ancylobacter mangrovi]|uniref:DUF3141 domain-containing protein n=1 Tax=Ancylobacter mangrovi TaxID=2972472 RepID=UPI0021631A70|nr:DUF3141 domain-containing protein [Ancylobacter mangrovi]MCS0501027.1 DUF3141 domain-containing protein [Ancylobacter mangrovi]
MTGPSDAVFNAWSDYAVDAGQRWVLFLDTLRQRGDTQIRMAAEPRAMVLWFDHEVVMSGRGLPRPINFALHRILPPANMPADPAKRPVMVIDPRAGQGAGIGGFKQESEIGDALAAGHPVYFIGFSAEPEPGQTFLDVIEGEIAFMERIAEEHPDAPRPAAIGNCQAGYQVLMAAALRPDLFGPCLIVGSPMSYWQGRRGEAAMRYLGGMLGGSWPTALTGDLGNGTFDGAWLVMNFDLLGPANYLWDKQYDVYAHVDEGAERYLAFERWWGDFVLFNAEEIQYLVDNMFVGDRLARGALTARDGTKVDLRALNSPTVILTSTRDHISPPAQTLGWIPDLYRDVEEIRAAGRVIVYAVEDRTGHLGLFVSARVADREDEEFVLTMDAINDLAPGLYEMVITPAVQDGIEGGPQWAVAFEPRTVDDVRAFGRNTPDENAAFAAVDRISQINLALYRAFVQPLVRAGVNEASAEALRALHPLRLSYTLFSGLNPWTAIPAALAPAIRAHRRPVAADNPFMEAQESLSRTISASIDAWRVMRDQATEDWFFGLYGSAPMQLWFGEGRRARRRRHAPA